MSMATAGGSGQTRRPWSASRSSSPAPVISSPRRGAWKDVAGTSTVGEDAWPVVPGLRRKDTPSDTSHVDHLDSRSPAGLSSSTIPQEESDRIGPRLGFRSPCRLETLEWRQLASRTTTGGSELLSGDHRHQNGHEQRRYD